MESINRILKGGYHNYYIPEQILHYKGESTEKSSFRYVHVFYGAMFIFFKKHFSAMNLLFSIPIKLAIYVKAFWATISMLSQNLNRSLGFVSSKKVPSDTLEEFLVCDTQNMEYREILKQLANSDHKRPIAFLYKDKKMVITPSDVIFDDL